MMNCAACCTLIEGEKGLHCTENECYKTYHILCAGGTNRDLESSTWECPECRCLAKRGGDNTLTPVGVNKTRDPNVTYRKKLPPINAATELQMKGADDTGLLTELNSLRQEMFTMRQLFERSLVIMNDSDKKITGLSLQIELLQDKLAQSVSAYAMMELELKKYINLSETISKNLTAPLKACTDAVAESQLQLQPRVIPPQDLRGIVKEVSKQTAQKKVNNKKPNKLPLLSPRPPEPPKQPEANRKRSPLPRPSLSDERSEDVSDSRAQITCSAQVNDKTPMDYPPTASLPIREVCNDAQLPHLSVKIPNSEKWTEVRRRPARQSLSLRCLAGPTVTSLKAVERRKFMHLWNMLSGADEVKQYLMQLFPQKACTVEELKTKNYYKSFKIGVPEECFDKCFSVDVWPENARVKVWVNHRKHIPETQSFQCELGPERAV